MPCKCGSRRKKNSDDFVIILLKDLKRNIRNSLSGLGSSPIFLETSEQFCQVPAASWYQFSTFGFNPFNKIIDEKWALNCECQPERGEWEVKVFWGGIGYNENGEVQSTITGGILTIRTERFPYNPAVVRVPLDPGFHSIRLLITPRVEEPYFLATVVERTTPRFVEEIQGITVERLTTSCYPGIPPTPPNGGDYPDVPSDPNPVSPPYFYLPPELPPVPPRFPLPPPPPPPPPPECCDCC